jgi:hypothetical protein
MLESTMLLATLLVSVGSASAQTLPLKRDLDIGAAEGEPAYEFSRITSIAVGKDGTIYVVNGASASIRAFTPQGKFLRELGRRGNGPGEFQSPGALRVMGDTLHLHDGMLRRTSLLDAKGELLTSWQTAADPQTRTMFITHAAVPGGWIVSHSEGISPAAGEMKQITVPFFFTTEPEKGFQAKRQPLVSFPYYPLYGILITGGPGGNTASAPLFAPIPRYGFDNLGRMYLARGQDYRIEVYDQTGKVVRTITRPHTPVPITDKLIADYRKEVSTYYDTARAQHSEWHIGRSASDGKGKLPTGKNLPALGMLYVSPQGTVLVERPDLRPNPLLPELPLALNKPQPAVYDLFDSAGRFIGSVRLGANFRPRAVTENAILGVERDELDVEHVVRYTFR